MVGILSLGLMLLSLVVFRIGWLVRLIVGVYCGTIMLAALTIIKAVAVLVMALSPVGMQQVLTDRINQASTQYTHHLQVLLHNHLHRLHLLVLRRLLVRQQLAVQARLFIRGFLGLLSIRLQIRVLLLILCCI